MPLQHLPEGVTRLVPVALLMLLVCAGCDGVGFDPSGEYVASASPPDSVTVRLDVVGDTIEAWGRLRLGYSVDLNGNTFEAAYAVLNGEEVAHSTNLTELVVDTRYQEDGVYPFRVVFVVRSGSGSLAAALGAEKGVVTWTGTLVIDNSSPDAVAVTRVARDDGALTVTWDRVAPDRVGFQNYTLYRSFRAGLAAAQPVHVATHPDATTFVDTTYFGGDVTYGVRVHASGKTSEAGAATAYRHPLSALRTPVHDGTTVSFSWAPNPFPRAFTRHRLERTGRSIYEDWTPVAEFTDPSDTTFSTVHDLFGAVYHYRLRTMPRDPSDIYSGMTDPQRVTVGDSVAWGAHGAWALPGADGYVVVQEATGTTPPRLQRYDGATKTLVDERPLPNRWQGVRRAFRVRPDGARGYLFDQRTVYAYDLNTLDRVATYDLSGHLPSDLDLHDIWVSNDERLFGRLIWYDAVGYTSYACILVDLTTMETVVFYDVPEEDGWRLGRDDTRDIIRVSPTGNYAVMTLAQLDAHEEVFAVQADTIQRVGPMPYQTTDPQDVFVLGDTFPDGPDHVAAYDDGEVTIYRFADLSVVRSFRIDEALMSLHYHADRHAFSGLAVRESDGVRQYLVYDAHGHRRHSIPVSASGRYAWKGGTLWSGAYYLDVE